MKNFNQLTEKQMSQVNGGIIGSILTMVGAVLTMAIPAVGVGIATSK